MTGCGAILALALACTSPHAQAARAKDLKHHQASEGNGNKCLQKVTDFDRVTFTCNMNGMARMRQCTKRMSKYSSQGYISCQDLGCECPKDHYCYKKPVLNASPFCLSAAGAKSLTDKEGTKFFTSGETTDFYIESKGCEFENLGFSISHLADTAGCVGDLLDDVRNAPAPLAQEHEESFMDVSEPSVVADHEEIESAGNFNKCMGVVASFDTMSFTCNLNGMAGMRQCAKKMSEYESRGFISCADLGCACAENTFCYKKPNLGRSFCLAAAEVESLTAKGKGLHESAKLPGKELFESTDCGFESFGFSMMHFTGTKGCEKGPGDEELITDIATIE